MADSKFLQFGPRDEATRLDIPFGEFLLERLKSFGDRVAQVQEVDGVEKQLRFSDIVRYSRGVVRVLRENDIGIGDTVMVACGVTLDFAPILVGIMTVGAVCCPIIPNYVTDEFKHLLRVCRPHLVVCDDVSMKNMQDAVGSQGPKVVSMATLSERGEDEDIGATLVADAANQVALVMTSSGTTGQPKGVEITQSVLYNVAARNAIPSQAVGLVPFAAYWVTGVGASIVGMCSGSKVVYIHTFTPEVFCDAVQKHKVNYACISPQYMMALAKFPRASEYDLSSLAAVGCGGTKATQAQLDAAEETLGIKVTPTYGMTEALRLMRPAFDSRDKPGSVGTPDTNYVAKVVDIETEQPLGPNTPGEVRFSGPSVLKGYRGDPEATRALFDSQGFIKSGDIGYYDQDGYFYITDRMKDHIKYKMTQLPCVDIESVILEHPAVLEAAVVGIPHEEDTEHSTAYVVKRPRSEVTAEEIQDLVKGKLSEMMWLHGGVVFTEELPKTMSGKVKKHVLRSQHKS